MSYHPLLKYLHVTVLTLVGLQFLTAWTMPELRGDSSPDLLVNIHLSFGFLILPLALIMIISRVYKGAPPLPIETPKAQRVAAHIMHLLLYLLLIVVPLVGLLWADARGWATTFFGLFNLPVLVAESQTLARTLSDWHELLANTLGVLVLGHAGAALYHHFIARDSVLRSMLPGQKDVE